MSDEKFNDLEHILRRADAAAQLFDPDLKNIKAATTNEFHYRILTHSEQAIVEQATSAILAYMKSRTATPASMLSPRSETLRNRAWDALGHLRVLAKTTPLTAEGRNLGKT